MIQEQLGRESGVQNTSLLDAKLRASRSDTLALVGIDLYRVSERDKIEWNNTECVFGDPKSILPLLLNRSSGAQWQVLSLVDPYKNTFIEYRHVGTLLKEFRLLEEYCPSAEERNWLLQAIAFVQELDESKPHVMFVGD